MFPRGKIDEQEDDTSCAVREVKEEVGVDVSKVINPQVRESGQSSSSSLNPKPLTLSLVRVGFCSVSVGKVR